MTHPTSTPESATLRPPMVTGLFREPSAAERAYDDAVALGYGASDINVLMSEQTRRSRFSDGSVEPQVAPSDSDSGAGSGAIASEAQDDAQDIAAWHSGRSERGGPGAQPPSLEREAAVAAEIPAKSAEIGGPIGGAVGTIAPVLAAVGTLLLIPGVVVAGPLAAALTAAGAVGIAGGVIGALTDWGIPKQHLRRYERDVRAGGILLGVRPGSTDDARRLEQAWLTRGGELLR